MRSQPDHLDVYELYFDTQEQRDTWYSYLLRCVLTEHIPCKAVVSGCACVAGLYDIEPADLREQHADDGHVGDEGGYPVLHALVALGLQKGGHEARAVIAVDLEYPVLYLLGHGAGGVNGEVSALGVAADDDGAVVGLGRPFEVRLGV